MKKFISNRVQDINARYVKRAMYLTDTFDEMLIVEMHDRTTFVCEYSCGYLETTSTQRGTFDQYFQLMPKFTYAKYEVFAYEY